MVSRLRLLAVGLLVASLAACPKRREPSADFSRASEAFSRLYARELDDAFLDPALRDIEALLGHVPEDSLDAQAAADLRARIVQGRTRMQKVITDRQAASAAALAPPAFNAANTRSAPAAAPAPAPRPQADAGTGVPTQPTAGMSVRDFNRLFGDCFQAAGPVTVIGRGQRDTWTLSDASGCQTRFPTFVASVVIGDGDALLGVVPKSSLVPPADAGAGTGPAPGAAADAGTTG